MYETTLAKTVYSNPAQPVRTLRGTEFELFAQLTRRLKQAAKGGKVAFPTLAAAIYDNRKLWTVLAADVASSDNKLPGDLRARLFYLNEFTQQHSRKVLAGQASATVLIEINTAVMRGLRQKVAAS